VVGAITVECSATVPAGIVIRQMPQAGSLVDPGSEVVIVVSQGPCNVQVPALSGMAQADAELALATAGLAPGSVTLAVDTAPAGQVIAQDPAAGSWVFPGTQVNLTVSLGPEYVQVPDVTGMDVGAAEAVLAPLGLNTWHLAFASSDTVAKDLIIETTPAPGEVVVQGTEMSLVISSGPEQVWVPALLGSSLSSAEQSLLAAGLSLGTVSQAYSTEPVDVVIDQGYPAGALVEPGTAVNLTVSGGPEPGVALPDLAGRDLGTASVMLQPYGITIGGMSFESSATVIKDLIIRSDPAAGTVVSRNSAVAVVISTGPVKVGVPYVVGKALTGAGGAEETLAAAQLAAGTLTTVHDNSVPEGQVINQGLAAGLLVDPGTAVDLTISSGPEPPVALPDVTGSDINTAANMLQPYGITISGMSFEYSSTVAQNLIISSDPTPGTMVARNSGISVTISNGPAVIPVPDLAGMDVSTASNTLNLYGITIAGMSFEYSSTVPIDRIIRSTPAAGSLVEWNSTVAVVISLGSEPLALMPNIVEQDIATAADLLLPYGITITGMSFEYSSTVPMDHVISSNPTAGTLVPRNSGVSVVVSKGAPPGIPVPNLYGLNIATADQRLIAAGLYMSSLGFESGSGVPAFCVARTIPAAGTFVPNGTGIKVIISLGP